MSKVTVVPSQTVAALVVAVLDKGAPITKLAKVLIDGHVPFEISA